jgi:hypothetical protein
MAIQCAGECSIDLFAHNDQCQLLVQEANPGLVNKMKNPQHNKCSLHAIQLERKVNLQQEKQEYLLGKEKGEIFRQN